MSAPPSARFPATAWSCIEAARDPQHPTFKIAVTRLITTYWRPVFHFLRAKRHAAADAENLTQEFFSRCLDQGSPLLRADRDRGRFRDLLRTLVRRFAYDQTIRPAKQAEFERGLVSIHDLMRDSDRTYEPHADETPDEAFDRSWKASLIEMVHRNLEALYTSTTDSDEQRRFHIFTALHFPEQEDASPTQDALAERFGITRDQVRYAIEQVRKRYQRLLRQEIRDQVGPDEDVDEEIRKLLEIG